MEKYYLGIDAASVSVSFVLINRQNRIVDSGYMFHCGDIHQVLRQIAARLDHLPVEQVAYNDRSSYFFQGGIACDEQIALIEGLTDKFGQIGSFFSIGGETFGLTIFSRNNKYKKYISNSSCAAGTGAFLDQQAERMGLSGSADLSSLAEGFTGEPPKIATRCAVFAKTDLIHWQQRGYSLQAIAAGLCKGVAHNIVDTIALGTDLLDPVFVVGGVSKSKRVVSCLSDLIGHDVIVPQHSEKLLAYGCALTAARRCDHLHGLNLNQILRTEIRKKHYFFEPLGLKYSPDHPVQNESPVLQNACELDLYSLPAAGTSTDVYLGIDIGSTSTKAIVTDTADEIIVGIYTRTAGQPVKAVQRIFYELNAIQKEYNFSLNIFGVGTTGSGRKFIRRVTRADMDVDEITAHARAAYELNQNVDTIIEIGGQDSKFTAMHNGQVTFSVMNYVCAAGTGSFIEEQARRLGVPLHRVADMALGTAAPLTSDRCTVFMERDLNHLLNVGYSPAELLAATMHSVRDNYLSRVAVPNKIGKSICFQGATAKNKALIAAFEQKLKKPIFVSKYCHLTGALGVCLLLKEEKIPASNFRGLAFSEENTKVHQDICLQCTNHCKLNIVHIGDEKLVWGYLCGRDESGKIKKSIRKKTFDVLHHRREVFKAPKKRSGTHIRRAIDTRNQISLDYLRENLAINYMNLRHAVLKNQKKKRNKSDLRSEIKIGIPNALYLTEHLPLWREFFSRMGYQVVVTVTDSKKWKGKAEREFSGAEFCIPLSVWFRSVSQLLEKSDFLFLPQMIENDEKFYCYYSNYAVPLIKNMAEDIPADHLICPHIDLSRPPVEIVRNIYRSLPEKIKIMQSPGDLFQTFTQSLRWYTNQKMQLTGAFEQHLRNTSDISVILLGRPYIILDKSMNQGIPQKFIDLEVATFYQDMIPEFHRGTGPENQLIEWNHWHYGDQILASAEYVCMHPGLYPVFLTAFKCSPDSFVVPYFKEIMERNDRPYLILQLDEMGSDVGYETRIEAAVRTFRVDYRNRQVIKKKAQTVKSVDLTANNNITTLVPNYDPLSCTLICAAFIHAGYSARLIEESTDTIAESLQYNDGQCLPLSAIATAAVDTIKNYNLVPENTCLFLNSLTRLACNFPQYPLMIKKIFEQIGNGFENVRVFASPFTYDIFPFPVIENVYSAYALGGLLRRIACKIRPYEKIKGNTDRITAYALDSLYKSIVKGSDKAREFSRIVRNFETIELRRTDLPRPKATIIGDLYVRDNDVFNQNLIAELESMGAEVVTIPFSYVLRLLAAKRSRILKHENRYISLMRHSLLVETLERIERKYYHIAKDILHENFPQIDSDLINKLADYGLTLDHGGETAQNVIKIHAIRQHFPDIRLFVHINPIFCCPGLVSEVIFKKIEREIDVPIISITYDGTKTARNTLLRPYLHYLRQEFAGELNSAL